MLARGMQSGRKRQNAPSKIFDGLQIYLFANLWVGLIIYAAVRSLLR
jgi:hypothetical protein